MITKHFLASRCFTAAIAAVFVLSGCGGGGGDSNESATSSKDPVASAPATATQPTAPSTVPAASTPSATGQNSTGSAPSTDASATTPPSSPSDPVTNPAPIDSTKAFYVSNTAGRGYTVGSDRNSGASSTPFATLQRALTVAPAGSRIVLNCGTYVAPAGAAFQVSKSVSIEALVRTSLGSENCVVLKNSAGQPTTIEVTGSGIDVTVRGVAIDGSGTTQQAMLINDSAKLNKIALDGVQFANVGTNGLSEVSSGNFTLNATNIGCRGSFAGSCISLLSHFAGNIVINGVTAKIQAIGTSGTGRIFGFNARAAGVTASISHVVGTVTGSTDASLRNYGIVILNSPKASVSYLGVPYGQTTSNDFLLVQALTPGSKCVPVMISNDPLNPIQADNPEYFNNRVQQDCVGGGHSSILWVSDGDPGPARRNLVQHARSHNNVDMAGPHVTADSNLEGPLCGWTSDCWIYDNVIQSYPGILNGPYGAIQKGTAGGYVFGNLILNPAHTGLLVKGGSGWNGGVGPQFWNNRVVVNLPFARAVICLNQVTDEAGNPATGWLFANNDCEFLVSGSAPVRFVSQTGNGNTGSFQTNNYYTTATIAGSGWESWNPGTAASGYANTFAKWKALAGGEPTAFNVNPMLTNANALSSGSPLIAAGTPTPALVNPDLAGRPFAPTPSIGSYQY